MQGTLLAVIHPDNTPHGYNLTFAFPMLMFIIQAGVLYWRFRSPHRVPGHVALSSSRWAGGRPASAAGQARAGQAESAGESPAGKSPAGERAGEGPVGEDPVGEGPVGEGTEETE